MSIICWFAIIESNSGDGNDESPKLDFLRCLFNFKETLLLQKFEFNFSLEFAQWSMFIKLYIEQDSTR